MNKQTRGIIVGSMMLLCGCEAIPVVSADGSRYYDAIPVGAVFTLQQALVIPADRVRVDLPRGREATAAGEYATGCSLELWTRNAQTVIVEPDQFTITRVSGGITPILVAVPNRVQVASRGYLPRIGGYYDDSSFLRSYAEFYLQSPRQPDVYRLTCGYIGDPWEVEPLTVAEIEQAIGSVMRLDMGGVAPGS
jgi:hypothetical protein